MRADELELIGSLLFLADSQTAQKTCILIGLDTCLLPVRDERCLAGFADRMHVGAAARAARSAAIRCAWKGRLQEPPLQLQIKQRDYRQDCEHFKQERCEFESLEQSLCEQDFARMCNLILRGGKCELRR